MSGAMAWNPAAASAVIWWRQEYEDSGKPWQSSTGGPWPCSAMLMRMPFVSTNRCVIPSMPVSLSCAAAEVGPLGVELLGRAYGWITVS
jgi:hypothetical protein